ncbi:hypothetical protein GALMADRAFT_159800 [Galerina marginata CBS 339.88]|uniref:F-box domain-containing protein n=1 Tax=Galerina marginata (strain CBS 339.88) TaxID=685588 RepID=A0A067SIB8_GALM3|nr:hypothetical protein GALMADRAFT_159800 [Galerina marginata CBS 339.88]
MLSRSDRPQIAMNSWSESARQISALHNDIVYEVFLWNASMFSESCGPSSLTTTRHTSQVCRAWRVLVLNAPAIWGRLIDRGSLNQKADHWRDKVLQRSRNSPLWIHWTISDTRPFEDHGRSFFFSTLDTHWDRIQHLQIDFWATEMENSLLQPLLRPAPHLRSCSLISDDRGAPVVLYSPSDSYIAPIFSNHAPSLYHFTNHCVSFSLSAPWLSQLRVLHLPHLFSVFSILYTLCSMPLLESLTIEALTTPDPAHTSVPLPTANLPELAKFCLKMGELGPLNDLLTHIRPADGYTVSCYSEITPSEYMTGSYKASFSTLSAALLRYLLTHTVTSFDFFLHPEEFRVYAPTSCKTDAFKIAIFYDDWEEYPADLYHSFLPIVSNCDFSFVTDLDLKLPIPLPTRPNTYFPLFSLFPSVTKLRTGDSTLRIFLDTPPNAENKASESIIFPLLDFLELDHTEEAVCDPALILEFLWRRRKSGKPIRQLDMGLMRDWVGGRDITTFLEELTGMEVMWGDNLDREFRYVCGSGQPDRIFVIPSSDDEFDEFDSSDEERY